MSVAARLEQDYGIRLRPGQKGECPFCGHGTFALKGDDTLGKCFHPACAKWLGAQSDAGHPSFTATMRVIFDDWHRTLVDLETATYPSAYQYLVQERKIHPQVVQDALLGAIPSGGYDVTRAFAPWLQWLTEQQNAPQGRGRPRQQGGQKDFATRLQDAISRREKLAELIAGKAGWLVFFYTDAKHQVVSLKFRQPFTKHFVTYKPFASIMGLFGHGMFHPNPSPESQALQRGMLVTEGEFNVLQLQSLCLRQHASPDHDPGYVYSAALGGVQSADVGLLQALKPPPRPIVISDHDANRAGEELVHRCQQVMTIHACTTPHPDSDLDSFIRGFETRYAEAWDAVKALIRTAERRIRLYSGTGAEFFERTSFIPKRLGEALLEADSFATIDDQLWVYHGGVYRPQGREYALKRIQDYLGETWRKSRAEDVVAYMFDATRLSQPAPSLTHVNCRNGRLRWRDGQLDPHTPETYDLYQIPLSYTPGATCPTWDRYLDSTLDAEMHRLVEEILGYCLLPNTRFEKAILLTGAGANGKSVFLNVLNALLGPEQVCHAAWQDLEEHRFTLAQLYGKLANLFADVDSRALRSTSMFKQLVAGDPLLAERKFGGQFTFRPFAKLIFSANRLPTSRDLSYGFFRRLIVVPFTRTFSGPDADRDLTERLTAELPGIFIRAVVGLQRLYHQGGFTETRITRRATEQYEQDVDTVAAFVAQEVEVDSAGKVGKQALFDAYRVWCQHEGLQPVSQKALRVSLQRLVKGLDEIRWPNAKSPWHWVGLRLIESGERNA